MIIFAGSPTLFAQETPATQPPRPQVPVVTPAGGSQPKPEKPAPGQGAPLPDSGVTGGFSYQKAGDDPNTYLVSPTTGGEPIRVSESFLGLVMRNPQLNDQQRTQVLQSYPRLVQKQYETAMQDMYPDASTAPAEPFQSTAVGTVGSPGGSATLEADPQAPGYVRVSLATPDGDVTEFSAAQSAVKRLLENPNMTDEQKLQALKNFPFKLPETARQDFKNLSREKLLELVSEVPDMQRQEFVKMAKYYPPTFADDDTTPTEDEDRMTTVVARPAATPEPTPAPTPAVTPETQEREVAVATPTPVQDEVPEVTPAAPPEEKEAGLSTTSMVAIGVVAVGLLAAIAVALGRRKQ